MIIFPSYPEAAVWIAAWAYRFVIYSTNPIAVIGFTKCIEPIAMLMVFGIGTQFITCAITYC
jgi:hypothetical protein